MTEFDPIKVFIRNQAGEYLVRNDRGWNFSPSQHGAYQFDYLADEVADRLRHAWRNTGADWTAWPVDPDLLLETCGRCGRKLHTFNAHFDGARSLCLSCATSAQISG